jgi:threonine dehydratase
MLRVLRHGLASAGRYLRLHVRVPDRPGSLATLLTELANADANVVDVVHGRTDSRLRLGEAEVELQLETKGPEHCRNVVQALEKAGFIVTVS